MTIIFHRSISDFCFSESFQYRGKEQNFKIRKAGKCVVTILRETSSFGYKKDILYNTLITPFLN